MQNDMATVSADTLLQGAWYALEQAGRLLNSSAIVLDAGDPGTALGIAMLGREELGKSRMLRKLAADVVRGHVVSENDVRTACGDHEDKQRAAALSTTVRTEVGTGLGRLLQSRALADVQSDEYRAATATLERVTAAQRKRAPSDRHRLRMNSIYVDLDSGGTGWNRPWDMTREVADNAIRDAISDYAAQRDRLLGLCDDLEMTAAAATMSPRAEPPLPRWPAFVDGK
jgi:AbiV family abortive infection protein